MFDGGVVRLLLVKDGEGDEMQKYLDSGWYVASVTEGECFDWVVIKKMPFIPQL